MVNVVKVMSHGGGDHNGSAQQKSNPSLAARKTAPSLESVIAGDGRWRFGSSFRDSVAYALRVVVFL